MSFTKVSCKTRARPLLDPDGDGSPIKTSVNVIGRKESKLEREGERGRVCVRESSEIDLGSSVA